MSELEKLKRIDGNEANLRRLVAQLRTDQGIVPFIGAGLSIPIGMPGWSTFLLTQAKRVRLTTEIQRRIQAGEFEEAAEDLLAAMRPRAFNDSIEDAFGDHNLLGKDFSGAVSYLPRLAKGPVITTNLDRVLERVFEIADRRFERVILGAKPDSFHHALNQGRSYLLKIHGDFEDASDRILTLTDYQRHYGVKERFEVDFSLPLPSLLKRVLLGRTFLLIGCSLTMDRTVSILRHIASEAPEVAHYAIVEMPRDKDQHQSKACQLADRGIRPIWFPSRRYDLITDLLGFLTNQVSAVSRSSSSPKHLPSEEPVIISTEKTAALRLSFDHLIERHLEIFAGRQEPLREIGQFISEHASGYVFVTGQSGFGKTSLLAKLVKDNPHFNYHFISQAYKTHGSHFDPTEMDSLLLNLCEQLESASRFENTDSLWTRFHQLLRKSPSHEQRVVVIDAIDEINRHPNYLLGLLPAKLPKGVFVIFSARKLGDRDYLAEVGLSRSDLGKTICLEGLDQTAISDLLKFAGGKASQLNKSKSFVEKLHHISNGDPFYLRFLVEDIRVGKITTASIDRIPSGLHEYFDIQLSILDRSINLPQQRDILGLVLDAYGPLARTDLINLVDGLDGLNFDNIVRDIRRFLLVHDDQYTFCHNRFKEYFSARR